MKLIHEKSRAGRVGSMPPCDERAGLSAMEYVPDSMRRITPPKLPEVPEIELVRHYSALARGAFGVVDGFYPLGSCTMKYNPMLHEDIAALPGFTQAHPLAPAGAVQGCLEAMYQLQEMIKELTGMCAVTLAPAAGAHGELAGMLLIGAYHRSRGDAKRTRMIVPDSAHGTNPASSAMAGFDTVEILSRADGRLDIDAIAEALDERVAGLMLTNPNTLGLFEHDILKVSQMVHDAGGLLYYDGANYNAIMGRARPGDMGFDVIHINVHKTLSTPHGMGGPGAGPVAVSARLRPFLPTPVAAFDGSKYALDHESYEHSIGRIRGFYGNFTVLLRALCYMLALGGEGLREVSGVAVLNANYLRARLKDAFPIAGDAPCMHEFVMSMTQDTERGVHAVDYAKALIDCGIHPPTMYFPLNVKEALMVEPTETETIETLDAFAEAMLELKRRAHTDAAWLMGAPREAAIGRPDDVAAARNPVVRG